MVNVAIIAFRQIMYKLQFAYGSKVYVCVRVCVCVYIIDELWHIHEHVSTKSRSRGMAGSSWRQPGTAKARTPLHHAAQKV